MENLTAQSVCGNTTYYLICNPYYSKILLDLIWLHRIIILILLRIFGGPLSVNGHSCGSDS